MGEEWVLDTQQAGSGLVINLRPTNYILGWESGKQDPDSCSQIASSKPYDSTFHRSLKVHLCVKALHNIFYTNIVNFNLVEL